MPEPDTNTPKNAIALTEQITPLLEQLRASLADPTVQALRQRDAFHDAWETAVHDLLKNMQHIHAEIRLIRSTIEEASRAGLEDTERIISAIEQQAAITRQMMAATAEAKARGTFGRLWAKLW